MPIPKPSIALALLLVTAAAFAQAAPWYQWKSKLNGKITCQQTTPGEGWERVGGPFKSDCKTPY